MSLIRLAVLAALILVAMPATAHAATAPGRVVYSVALQVPRQDAGATVVSPAVALPDGGAVIVPNDDLTAVRLRADGSLEPSFGNGGIAHIAVPGAVFTAIQVLRQPGGRLVVVGAGPDEASSGVPRLVVVGLTATGALDTTFGTGGFTVTDVEPTCDFGACHIAALGPDGSIVVTGTRGQLSPDADLGNSDEERPEWVVRRLSPTGAVDASFGLVKIPGVARSGTEGTAAVVRPTGQIVVLGSHASIAQVAGLTPAGKPDPSFGGGRPVRVAGSVETDLLLHASGKVDVLTGSQIWRFQSGGALDRAYGKGGVVDLDPVDTGNNLPQLADGGGDATILQWIPTYEPGPPVRPRLGVLRVSPAGALGGAARLPFAFGGGYASDLGETTGSVEQNTFSGELLARPDGSYLVVGGVRLIRLTTSLSGSSAGYVAVAALTPALGPDPSFGGPASAPRATVTLASQRASSTVALRGVLARVTASGAGLLRVSVRDPSGRILARRTEAVYAAGTTRMRVTLTKAGKRLLRRARDLRVRARYEFRDLVAGRSDGEATARLR